MTDQAPKKPKRPRDANRLAKAIVEAATTDEGAHAVSLRQDQAAISAAAAALGRKGGLKGGKVRAERLSPERRAEIARSAASARWSSRKDDD